MGFFGGRVWVGFEAKQGQRCCAAWPLPPSKPPSLHLTISIGIRPSRNCPSRLQRILNLTMCFCSLDNKDEKSSLRIYSHTLTFSPRGRAFMTSPPRVHLRRRWWSCSARLRSARTLNKMVKLIRGHSMIPARHDCRLQKENSSDKNLTHITATIVVIVVINISVSLFATSGLFEWSGKITKNQENTLRPVTDWWCFPQAVTAEDKGGRLDKLDKLDSPFVPIFNLPPNCAVLRWLWALRFFLICFWKHIAPVYVVGAHSALP